MEWRESEHAQQSSTFAAPLVAWAYQHQDVTSLLTCVTFLPQIRVADSAAVPYVLHRGGVIEAVSVRATPRYGPADNQPRFSNVAIKCVCQHAVRPDVAIAFPHVACSAAPRGSMPRLSSSCLCEGITAVGRRRGMWQQSRP